MIFHHLSQTSNQPNTFLSKLAHRLRQSFNDYLHKPSTVIDCSRSITILEDYQKGFKPLCLVQTNKPELVQPSDSFQEEKPKKQTFPTIKFIKPSQHSNPVNRLSQPSYTFYETQKFDLFADRGQSSSNHIQPSFIIEDIPSSTSLPTDEAREASLASEKNDQVIVDNPFLPKNNHPPCEKAPIQPTMTNKMDFTTLPMMNLAQEKKGKKASDFFSNPPGKQSIFGPPENRKEEGKKKKKKKQVRVD